MKKLIILVTMLLISGCSSAVKVKENTPVEKPVAIPVITLSPVLAIKCVDDNINNFDVKTKPFNKEFFDMLKRKGYDEKYQIQARKTLLFGKDVFINQIILVCHEKDISEIQTLSTVLLAQYLLDLAKLYKAIAYK